MAKKQRRRPPAARQQDAGRTEDQLNRQLSDAFDWFESGEIQKAIAGCEMILKADPRQPDAVLLLGVSHLRLGNLENAIAQLRIASKLQPSNHEVLLHLGFAYQMTNAWPEAADAFRQSLVLQPNNAPAWNQLAVASAQADRPHDAVDAFRNARKLQPDSADIAVNLCRALGEIDELDEARAVFREVRDSEPDNPSIWKSYGDFCLKHGDANEAFQAFSKTIDLAPDHLDARVEQGCALLDLSRIDDAVETLSSAISHQPENARAHYNLGYALGKRGDVDGAVTHYRQAVELTPDYERARESLGRTLQIAGRLDEAEASFRQWLQHDPTSSTAKHMLAALTGSNVPERATDHYVEETFDRFADKFDESLAKLEYQAPRLVVDALTSTVNPASNSARVLDAGCGTGLCGPLLRPYAQHLTGIDLSGGMLSQAKKRGVYDALHKVELTEFLEDHPTQFDIIIAADTFNYFGDLARLFSALHRSLQAGGHVLFTLERHEDEVSFTLHPHGRYSHSHQYLLSSLEASGLEMTRCESGVLRTEDKKDVHGWIIVARKSQTLES